MLHCIECLYPHKNGPRDSVSVTQDNTHTTWAVFLPDICKDLLCDLLRLHLVPVALGEVQRLPDAPQTSRTVLSVTANTTHVTKQRTQSTACDTVTANMCDNTVLSVITSTCDNKSTRYTQWLTVCDSKHM